MRTTAEPWCRPTSEDILSLASSPSGIGHMTILFAKALRAEVTAVSRIKDKEALAKQLGAAHFAATDGEKFVEKVPNTVDVFVNTGNSFKGASFDKCMKMFRPRGQLYFITVQPVGKNLELIPSVVVVNNTSVHFSAIGSPEELEYMLELTSKHIKPWVETVVISEENLGKTWKHAKKGDGKFRFTMVGYDKSFSARQ